MVRRNKEQAQGVLDYLRRFPQKHDQSNWFHVDGGKDVEKAKVDFEKNYCNTSMCVAGTVVFNNYGTFGLGVFEQDEEYAVREATRLLGITEDEAQTLFYDVDDTEAVIAVERIAQGKKNIFKGTDYEADFA